jgi:hypothetical protein
LNRGWRFCRPYKVVSRGAWLRLLVPDDAWFSVVFGRSCSEVAPKFRGSHGEHLPTPLLGVSRWRPSVRGRCRRSFQISVLVERFPGPWRNTLRRVDRSVRNPALPASLRQTARAARWLRLAGQRFVRASREGCLAEAHAQRKRRRTIFPLHVPSSIESSFPRGASARPLTQHHDSYKRRFTGARAVAPISQASRLRRPCVGQTTAADPFVASRTTRRQSTS